MAQAGFAAWGIALWIAMEDACFSDAAGDFWPLVVFFKVPPPSPDRPSPSRDCARSADPAGPLLRGGRLMRVALQVYVVLTTIGAISHTTRAAAELFSTAPKPDYQPV